MDVNPPRPGKSGPLETRKIRTAEEWAHGDLRSGQCLPSRRGRRPVPEPPDAPRTPRSAGSAGVGRVPRRGPGSGVSQAAGRSRGRRPQGGPSPGCGRPAGRGGCSGPSAVPALAAVHRPRGVPMPAPTAPTALRTDRRRVAVPRYRPGVGDPAGLRRVRCRHRLRRRPGGSEATVREITAAGARPCPWWRMSPTSRQWQICSTSPSPRTAVSTGGPRRQPSEHHARRRAGPGPAGRALPHQRPRHLRRGTAGRPAGTEGWGHRDLLVLGGGSGLPRLRRVQRYQGRGGGTRPHPGPGAARRDITVNAVAPGPTSTKLFLEGQDEQAVARLAALPSMDRLAAPADIARIVAFLAAPAGHWVNGQVVRANGGAAPALAIWSAMTAGSI